MKNYQKMTYKEIFDNLAKNPNLNNIIQGEIMRRLIYSNIRYSRSNYKLIKILTNAVKNQNKLSKIQLDLSIKLNIFTKIMALSVGVQAIVAILLLIITIT